MTTLTESPTEAAAATAMSTNDGAALSLQSGVVHMLTTTDHKRVGAMYVRLALVFAAAIAVVGAIAGIENIDRDSLDLFGGQTVLDQMNWLYGTGLIVLVVMPLLVGIGTAVVPLQVGSTSIAFPRAAAGGFWTWLVGAGAYVGSFIVDGGFSSGINVDDRAVALTIAALGVTVAGLMLSMICIATTVIALRPSGMTLRRVPVLSWSMMIATVVWLLSLAVLIANLVVEYVTLQHTNRNVDAFESITWMLSGPQVFAFAIPVLGIVGDIIPVATGQKQKLYDVLLGGIAAFGLLSFGAFAQSKYSLGTRDVTDELTYILVGLAIVLPLLAVVGGFADTLRLGRKSLSLSTALLGAIAALLMLLVAALANAVRVIGHWGIIDDWNESHIMDRGVMHYAVLAGLIAGVAAMFFWAPKIFGRRFNEGLGRLAIVALLAGTVVISLPDIIAGFLNDSDALDVLAMVSMVGGFIVAAGALLALGAAALGLLTTNTEVVPDNPWKNGMTLEWATTSPPPYGNFAAPVATVLSETPLLDEHDDGASSAGDSEVDA